MALLITQDMIELTKVGLNEVYLNEIDEPSMQYTKLFDVKESKKSFEEEIILAGFGTVPPWDADGGKVLYDKPLSGERVRFIHTDYAMAWTVSHKLLRDDLYNKTSKELVTAASLSTRHSIEQDALNIFNTGFTVNGPDGVPLFSNNHPLLGGGVQSNLGTPAALTKESLKAMLTKIRRSVNERGQPVSYIPDTLLVPPELEMTVWELLESSNIMSIAGANTAAAALDNPVKGMGFIKNVIISPYLTSDKAWFIGAIPKQRFTKFFWRERPWYDADKDFETKGVANSVAYAYSVGYTTYKGWWGNAGG